MAERLTLFASVLLPLPVPKTYTYRVPHEWNDLVQIGQRVVVQFGPRKIYSGIILDFSDTPPEKYDASYIIELMEEEPVVNPSQLRFWHWVSTYYMCHPGEVMAAALPAGLRLQSESLVVLHPEFDVDQRPELDEKEAIILDEVIRRKELKPADAAALLGQKSAMRYIRSLYLRGLVLMKEEVVENYKPRLIDYLALATEWQDESFARATMEKLEKRAPKQADAIVAVMGMGRGEFPKKELTEKHGIDAAHIRTLVQKGLLLQFKRQADRLKSLESEPFEFSLSPAQQKADENIINAFGNDKNVLLYGATGSGKTYLYISRIREALATGRQVLMLVPEVALTEQMVARLSHYFGAEMGVWHNYYSGHERTELYEKVRNGSIRFVIGARSALFAPFERLGLVVIDEEHENSFKQFDKRPHYHGRDAAIQLAHFHGCQVLAGSATPSYELWHACHEGKWELVRLSERFNPVPAPEISLIHTGEARRSNAMKGPFSNAMLEAMEACMSSGQQIIVYQNRKGFVPYISCEMCGYTTQCINCDITLTYFKSSGKQRCTYCGYAQDPMALCPACGSTSVNMRGYGTERLTEELSVVFPQARVARLDQESVRKRSDFQRILNGFANKDIDILVGTQLLSKGLDFQNVGLVAVPDADLLLNIPDFRTNERAYQQLFQVAGRAGRGNRQGKVMIQTSRGQHPVLEALTDGDYESLALEEINMRREFDYPPFTRLIRISVKHKDARMAEEAAQFMAARIRPALRDRLMGPNPPGVARVRNYFIQQMLVRLDKTRDNITRLKEFMWEQSVALVTNSNFKGALVDFDVDPA